MLSLLAIWALFGLEAPTRGAACSWTFQISPRGHPARRCNDHRAPAPAFRAGTPVRTGRVVGRRWRSDGVATPRPRPRLAPEALGMGLPGRTTRGWPALATTPPRWQEGP